MMAVGLVLLASCCGRASVTGEGRDTEGMVSGTGTVKFIDLEGGFYGIIGDDGSKYDPINLGLQFKEDGLRIRFEANVRKDVAGIHMWGTIVDITKIEKLESTAPKAGMRIKLYYYNKTKAEEIGDTCSPDAVLPVEREIPVTNTPIQDTIRLLIQGELTAQEKDAGFYTEYPLAQFELLSASLWDGVITLKFSDPADKTGGGSCRVRPLWAQIQKTAKQFPEVKEVRFEPEGLFQP
jgi:hypothetical protein